MHERSYFPSVKTIKNKLKIVTVIYRTYEH